MLLDDEETPITVFLPVKRNKRHIQLHLHICIHRLESPQPKTAATKMLHMGIDEWAQSVRIISPDNPLEQVATLATLATLALLALLAPPPERHSTNLGYAN